VVSAEEAAALYRRLDQNGIRLWLTGGWGIDALRGEQSRPHKDLDLIMLVDDVVRMRELLGRDGYGLIWLWEENRPTVDARGIETATAFILQDAQGREIDVHAMRLDACDNGIPAWEGEGITFSRSGLAGEGVIAGTAVRCLDHGMQLVCHSGYELPEAQVQDLELLRRRFGDVQ